MTNLQILLSVLDLESEIYAEAIIAYFNDQDCGRFEINNDVYYLFDEYDLNEEFYNQLENEYFKFLEYCKKYKGTSFLDGIEESDLINFQVGKMTPSSLEGYIFIEEVNSLCIFKER